MDFDEQIERDERAMERIASALERLAKVEEKKFRAEHPAVRPKRPAVITRPSDDKRDQFDDRADQAWVEETERTASRFKQRYQSPEVGSTPTKAGGSAEDESKPGQG